MRMNDKEFAEAIEFFKIELDCSDRAAYQMACNADTVLRCMEKSHDELSIDIVLHAIRNGFILGKME